VIPRHKGSPRYQIAHGWKNEFGYFNLETLKFLIHFREPGSSFYFIFTHTHIFSFLIHIYIHIYRDAEITWLTRELVQEGVSYEELWRAGEEKDATILELQRTAQTVCRPQDGEEAGRR
jgi:hypothetical protein